MGLIDSRRITGPSLLLDEPGAVIEVEVAAVGRSEAAAAWSDQVRRLLDAVGWSREAAAWRLHAAGATLAISAPIDALYAACEVNEAAWAAVIQPSGPARDLEVVSARLRQTITEESRPLLLQLRAAAARHDVAFVSDDERVSMGTGEGASSWAIDALPHPDTIDWTQIRNVPTALITGTNGKTTTVRMIATMAGAAGITAANTSTDGVQIDGVTELVGDYTGGEGARRVLRDPRVALALLENARGGILRRGLPLDRVDAALITNVGDDHLGEYGIDDVEAMAAVKCVVAKAVRGSGLVVNGDDPLLVSVARTVARGPISWTAVEPGDQHLGRLGGTAWICRDNRLGRWCDGMFVPVVDCSAVPATLGGAAVHNVYNALGALAVGSLLGIPTPAAVAGLEAFDSDPATNPGRGNLFDLGGTQVYADFAHNADGLRTVLRIGERLEAKRRLVILGQAGDRTDAAIDALADIVHAATPDRIVLKEMHTHARGRAPGEVVARLRSRLAVLRYRGQLATAASELDAVRDALAWARPGDLLFLLLHAERAAVLRLLTELQTSGWRPGAPLPDDGDR